MRGLDAKGLASVVALAAWRQRVAVELDRPLGQVLNDKNLVELARLRPRSVTELRGMKGLAPIARTRGDELHAVLVAAKAEDAPVIITSRAPSLRAQRWSEILIAIAQLVAEQIGVAGRLLATRSDAEEVARIVDEQGLDAAATLPVFTTWRREVLGAVWSGWLRGEVMLVGDVTAPHGLRLLPR